MIISKEFYDQCCPSYQKVIDELEQTLDQIYEQYYDPNVYKNKEIARQQQYAIFNFSKRYLLPAEYWSSCIELVDETYYGDHLSDEFKERRYEIRGIAYQHFYVDNEVFSLDTSTGDEDMHLRLIDFEGINIKDDDYFDFDEDDLFDFEENDLMYPHNCLKKCFHEVEKQASHLFSKNLIKRYKEMKAFYPIIEAAKDDTEKWFKLLLEVEDEIFLKNNVEYRLGKNLLDVKLWKLYIEHLKQNNDHWSLLEVLSKYIRFFLDDVEMLEFYKSVSSKYGPIDLCWSNVFDFEINGGEEEDVEMQSIGHESNDEDESMDALPLDRNLCATFYDTYQTQKFFFKTPLILYILENCDHRILRNLFKSCKYFFAKKSTPICYSLIAQEETAFDNEKLELSHFEPYQIFLKKTYITTNIDIRCSLSKTDFNYISNIIPHLSKCDAKYIYLIGQHLTFNELKFLIQNGHAVSLEISGSNVKDENNEYVDLEKIMQYLPNVEKLELPTVKCNSNTAHALTAQKRNKKIHSSSVTLYGEPFDLYEFQKFCIENRDEKFLMTISFNKKFNPAFVKKFSEIMDDYKKTCENTHIVSRYSNFEFF